MNVLAVYLYKTTIQHRYIDGNNLYLLFNTTKMKNKLLTELHT